MYWASCKNDQRAQLIGSEKKSETIPSVNSVVLIQTQHLRVQIASYKL